MIGYCFQLLYQALELRRSSVGFRLVQVYLDPNFTKRNKDLLKTVITMMIQEELYNFAKVKPTSIVKINRRYMADYLSAEVGNTFIQKRNSIQKVKKMI